MGSKYRNDFFDSKRDWSKYKDSILDYYLKPYLQKVKQLGKPICIVDMFAGRGEFKTGEPGSPRIIASLLQAIAEQGYHVKLRCYENYQPFYDHLATVLKPFPFAEALHKDCFTDVADIAQLASTYTTLLYIDPCDVVQLSLSKLGLIFEKVRQNSSVEALIVFMAQAFMRQAAVVRSVEMRLEESGALNDPLVNDAEDDDKAMWIEALHGEEAAVQHVQSQKYQAILNDIAGGDYWQAIVQDSTKDWKEKCAELVKKYRDKLHNWFKVAEALPVYSDTSAAIPKYWIAFMSRYEPAFDLFNRAACDMIRAQRQNFRKPDTLFMGTEPQPEAASPTTVDRAVKHAAQPLSPCRWKELRWRTCGGQSVGKFTDSEVNQSIKRLLKAGLLSGAAGEKVEEDKILFPTAQLKSWLDR